MRYLLFKGLHILRRISGGKIYKCQSRARTEFIDITEKVQEVLKKPASAAGFVIFLSLINTDGCYYHERRG